MHRLQRFLTIFYGHPSRALWRRLRRVRAGKTHDAEDDCWFYGLLRKHFGALLGIDYRAIRIRELRAELAALEDSEYESRYGGFQHTGTPKTTAPVVPEPRRPFY